MVVVGALTTVILIAAAKALHQESFVATNVPREFFNFNRLDFKTVKTSESEGLMEAATFCILLAKKSQICSAFRCRPDKCRYAAFPNDTSLLVIPGEVLADSELRKTIWVKKSMVLEPPLTFTQIPYGSIIKVENPMCGAWNQRGTEVHFFLKVGELPESGGEALTIHLGDQLRLVLGLQQAKLYRNTTIIVEKVNKSFV